MMWNNYLITSTRSLTKRKLYTLINIGGLALGIACFILLFLFLQNEWTYDRFHKNANELYRINLKYGEIDQPLQDLALTPSALAPAIKSFPEIKAQTRVYMPNMQVANGNKSFNESRFLYAEAPFFSMFSFPLIEGNAATALNGPNMVVVTASMADKYFGTTNVTGKTIKVNDKNYLITGVAKDAPSNSHLKFDFVGSYSSLGIEDKWGSANYYTYVQLTNKSLDQSLHRQLTTMVKEQMGAVSDKYTFDLIPESIKDIHLYSKAENSVEPGGNLTYDYMLAITAILLLGIACINFMNLATARSADRAKEVGVRKVMGAVKKELLTQFLTESAIITFFALILGITVALLCLPRFNDLTNSHLSFFSDWKLSIVLLLVFIFTTLMAGVYPAFFLAKFKPVQVLKGKTPINKGGGLRKGLVVFQFTAAAFFIICTLVVGEQLSYIQNKNLGQERSHVLVLNGSRFDSNTLAAFKTNLLQQSGVEQVSASYDSPVSIGGGYGINRIEGKPANYSMDITAMPSEKDYLQTMGIKLIAGEALADADIQDVLKNDENSKHHFYLNESAIKKLGWTPAEAIGKAMSLNGRNGTVKGVMKDFHFASLRQKIQPLIVFPEYNWFGEILVKVNGQNIQHTIAGIENSWNSYQPGKAFEYHFMDDDFNSLYKAEFQAGKLLNTFSSIVILISCLGLIGLAAYTAEQRTKELGIRKVLGATTGNLIVLLSKDYIKLVLIALLFAIPLGGYFMHKWLTGFAYHTSMSVKIFMITGVAAVGTALITVCIQSVKAALKNPITSLKSE
ncbi:ABC transporter permease [Chitinophaga silvatica]|uniref:ABC transporter permease n=1 Tax=Chitinophaga silvatica TaxID=2282649 RepID=A0A3E1YDH4_9BACT|nr:ABC transporter permease [Chitinophaga silvatica]RFS24054.1 ABC transporter permease [Chitinophaga silvatica]